MIRILQSETNERLVIGSSSNIASVFATNLHDLCFFFLDILGRKRRKVVKPVANRVTCILCMYYYRKEDVAVKKTGFEQ